MTTTDLKLVVARVADFIGLNRLGLLCQKWALGPYIRIFYVHGVNQASASAFEAQLAYIRRNYRSASRSDLLQLLDSGTWPHAKPGAIVTFDDGLLSNFVVAAPLLEKFGFQGWFFVPIGLCLAPVEQQFALAAEHLVDHDEDQATQRRLFMDADELRELATRHIVGCHTMEHVRLSSSLSEQDLLREIGDAGNVLEKILGSTVDSFAWVGGEEWAYAAAAAGHVHRKYRLCFTTNSLPTTRTTPHRRLDRTHLEPWFPLWLLRFQCSGLVDLLYAGKRARISRRWREAGVSLLSNRT